VHPGKVFASVGPWTASIVVLFYRTPHYAGIAALRG
jgi:hypothetical protein